MRDFTIRVFIQLIEALCQNGYQFNTFEQYLSNKDAKGIILRHDIDALAENALSLARVEYKYNIRGTYNFRTISGSFDERIINEIFSMGHEIGYHYEDLASVSKNFKSKSRKYKFDEYEKHLSVIAIQSFKDNLECLRRIAPVKTICMHGSPMSRWDSRLLWKYYNYKDFDLIGEPYFDIDFNEVLYLTDTGRVWNGNLVNVRDKYRTGSGKQKQELSNRFHSTFDIIKATKLGNLPEKIMITFHPQRWTDNLIPWVKEFMWQNIKNTGKFFLIKLRN